MFIKDLLKDQKVFDAIADVDALMQENKIDYDSWLVSFTFEKKVFRDRSEVVEWLSKYGWQESQIVESEDQWIITNYEPGIFDEITLINVRRGIDIVVGKFVYPENANPFVFSLHNKDGVQFSDKIPTIIEVAKVVEGYHASYGKVKITKEDLRSMVKNFSSGAVGIDISFDFEHAQAEASCWVKKLFLSEDEETLHAEVKWTPEGAQALSAKKFRYFSPEFTHNYVHPHSRIEFGCTLLGGGLVNRPFLKMDAIVPLSEKNHLNPGDPMSTISLKDHDDKVAALNEQIALSTKSIETAANAIKSLKEENVKLSTEVTTLKDAQAKKEVEAQNQKLFDEGKINAAQLKAMNEGKSAFEVMSLSAEMNPNPKGVPPGKDTIQLSEAEVKICKDLGLTPEEYINGNK